MERSLLDEFRFLLYPLTVSAGAKMFKEGANFKFRLVESKPFSNGVIALRYALEPAEAAKSE
jgi:dihydrofolate reductase